MRETTVHLQILYKRAELYRPLPSGSDPVVVAIRTTVIHEAGQGAVLRVEQTQQQLKLYQTQL